MCICGSPLGSGSLAAMAVFEDRYRPDLEVGLSHWPFDQVSHT